MKRRKPKRDPLALAPPIQRLAAKIRRKWSDAERARRERWALPAVDIEVIGERDLERRDRRE